MTNDTINIIKRHLPRYSEEGGEASLVSIQDLLDILTSQLDKEPLSSLEATLEFVETVLHAMSLLDTTALAKGQWQFVSHPAQLCALSLMESLADPKQRFLPEGFWHTAGVSDDVKRQQKSVLKALEDRRRDCRPDGSLPQPIRFIYVAWSIIMIDGKFIFHRREAKEHSDEYTLTGGRVNLQDLKSVLAQDVPIADLLQELQSPSSKPMFEAMGQAIIRELKEETHLCYPEHYSVTHYRDLSPYSQCMGAAPNYAFTQYFFRIYRIDLTTTGYFKLRQAIRYSQGDLIECDISEILAGKTVDGGRKFTIDAIYRHFHGSSKEFARFFEQAISSYINLYRITGEDNGVVLSLADMIIIGAPGKEKPVLAKLAPQSKEIVAGLGGYAKGFPCRPVAGLTPRDYGWVEVAEESLQNRLREVAEELRVMGSPLIDVQDGRYFRLAVDPEVLFFDSGFFTFSIVTEGSPSKNKIVLRICRRAIDTPLGRFSSDETTFRVTRPLADELSRVKASGVPCIDEGQLAKRVRSAAQKHYQALGLRLLLKVRDKDYVIACPTL